MGVDVLNLEWEARPSRDRESATLVCNYLRYQGLSVIEGCIFQGYSLIDKYQPKVLFVTNSVGARVNLDVISYAKSQGVYCITSSSEGNFKEESIQQFFWGVNKERVLQEDCVYLWNKASLEMSLSAFPAVREQVGVCGSIGFDRYKIIPKKEKKSKGSRKLKVAVSCWNFDFLNKKSNSYGQFNGKALDTAWMKFFEREMVLFNNELIESAKNNMDVDFVVKLHPGCLGGEYYSGAQGLNDLDNVTIIHREKTITEVIQSSDLLISYESTTALEAWLSDKPTILLNPSGTDFIMREGFHTGQPNALNSQDVSNYISELKLSGEIFNFNRLNKERKKIIRNIIEWDDGLNHVRLGNEIIQSLGHSSYNKKFNFKYFIKKIKQDISWTLYKYGIFNSVLFREIRCYWSDDTLSKHVNTRMKEQIDFYTEIFGEDKFAMRDVRAYKS